MQERDEVHGDMLWNTAVVIGNKGNVIGKHRKARTRAQSYKHLATSCCEGKL